MSTRRSLLGLALAAALGSAAGNWYGRRAELAAAQRLTVSSAPVAACAERAAPAAGGVDTEALAAAVRRVVQEELAAARAAAVAPAPAKLAAAVTPEAGAALAAGRSLLTAARAQGRWTEEDADSFREILSRLDDAGRDDALTSLTRAVNLGELSVETRGPLL